MFEETKAFSSFSVDDTETAKRFYGETLGLEVSEEEMEIPLLTLHLASGAEVMVYPKGDDHEPASFTVLNFPVPEIEPVVAELRERGVEFERYEGSDIAADEQGILRGPGPTIAWFKDPAGNVLSVIEVDES